MKFYILLLLLFTFNLNSQENESSDGQIVVTGTRSKKLLKDSTVKTEVITKKDLDSMGARTIADALGNVPGMQVKPAESGQRGEVIQIQGLSSQNVLILVDGQRVSGRFNGAIDLTRFKVEEIERIEIVKGATSSLYGSDAIAGVINIITKEASKPFQASFRTLYGSGRQLYYGSGNEFRNTFSLGLKKEKYSTQFNGGWHKGDGYDLTPDASPGPKSDKIQSLSPYYNVFPENMPLVSRLYLTRSRSIYEPPLENTTGNAFRDLNISNKTIIHLTEKTNLTTNLFYRYLDQEGVTSAPPRTVYDRENKTHDFMGSVTLDSELTSHTNLTLNANYSRFKDDYSQDQRKSDELDKKETTDVGTYEFRSRLDLKQIADHTISLGAEGLFEQLSSPRVDLDCKRKAPFICSHEILGFPPTVVNGFVERNRKAVFIQDEWTYKNGFTLRVIPGIRYEDDSGFGSQTMPKLSIRLDPAPKWIIRASSGLGYRAPSFQDLYFNYQNPGVGYKVSGNTNLKPEISRSYNLGLEWEGIPNTWISLNAFYNAIDNLIAFRRTGNDAGGLLVYRTENFEKAYTTGLETSITTRLNSYVSGGLGYTYTDSKDKIRNLPLEGRGYHRGNVNLKLDDKANGYGLSLFAVVYGKQPFYCELNPFWCKEDNPNLLPTQIDSGYLRWRSELPQIVKSYCSDHSIAVCSEDVVNGVKMVNAYTNINIRIYKKIDNNTELFAGVDNLLERFHIQYNPTRPRFFYFGANLQFEAIQ